MIGSLSIAPLLARGRLRSTLSAARFWVALASVFGAAPSVQAICDVIPGPSNQLRAAVGAADRPFAGPGEFVDVKIRPQVCDRTSLGLKDVMTPSGVGPEDVAVTVIFTPPGSAPRHAVVTATDCARFTSSVCVGGLSAGNLCTNDLQCLGGSCTGASKLSACQAQLGAGGAASCVAATGSDLDVTSSATEGEVRFRFPDTDALVGTATDDRTLAGPATIAISPPNAALPCGLASQRCAVAGGTIACVDELYAIDGTCSTQAAALDGTFQHFTALPPPNNYEAVCDTPGTPCDGTATEVRFTTDVSGNVLVPWDWRGVLVRLDDVPIPRLVRLSTTMPAFTGSPAPPSIPDNDFLSAWSPNGRRIAPLFDPLTDPEAVGSTVLFGSVDAPLGISRIVRRGCLAGPSRGAACTSDVQCPASTCGPPLFDFADRYVGGIGPVVMDETAYVAEAQAPVPIDGLQRTESMYAFVQSEALVNADLNGDGDLTDPVVMLRDGKTGSVQTIGAGGSAGRAGTRIRQLPFTFAALGVENDLVAFLEAEPLQGECNADPSNCDHNGDGDDVDSVLRVYRLGTAGDLTASVGSLSADPEPVFDGESLAVSDGLVFFRTSEASQAHHAVELVSVGMNGNPGNGTTIGSYNKRAISNDGRYVGFGSTASNLVPGDTNNFIDVFLRDRAAQTTTRVSLTHDGQQANPGTGRGYSGPPLSSNVSVSDDGQIVGFQSASPNLVAGDTNGSADVFVRLLSEGPTTLRVGTGSTTADAAAVGMSPDGRFITYGISAGGNAAVDPILFDRTIGQLVHLAPTGSGLPSDRFAAWQLTPDARFVGFASSLFLGSFISKALLPNDPITSPRSIEPVTITSTGEYAPRAADVALSDDGRFAVFTGFSSDIVAGDTNGTGDVFVRDRLRGITERVSTTSSGAQTDGYSNFASISRDGRYVVFQSLASNLVPNDAPNTRDVFLTDRLTGFTTRMGRSTTGDLYPSLSGDGRAVAFTSKLSNLVPNDTNGTDDLFVYAPMAGDCPADLTGDCDLQDQVLRVFDAEAVPPSVLTLGPARMNAIAGGNIAFIGADDGVVRLWRARQANPPIDLGRRAEAIAMSESWLAALVSEADEGADLNGDGDQLDRVVFVNPVSTATSGSWVNVGQAGEGLAVAGSRVAFLTSELAQGLQDLNGNGSYSGDESERVLQIYDAATATLSNLGAAHDFVLGSEIVAFRTKEGWFALPPEETGNRDHDLDDFYMQVHDFATGITRNTEQAAVPCDLEACDPRIPYRVSGSTVRFLTLELQQLQDLNGDGDGSDVIVQVYNARQSVLASASEAVTVIASTSSGLCSDSGGACASDAECASGICFVPPGACVLSLGTNCNPAADPNLLPPPCPSGQFCRPINGAPLGGICHERLAGSCRTDPDCTGGARCEDVDQDIQQIVAPLAPASSGLSVAAGEQVFAGAGVCREPLGTACTPDPGPGLATGCGAGEACVAPPGDPGNGSCHREHGACKTDSDCAAGACVSVLTTATAADQDGDTLADPIDNCPSVPNPAQADLDEDDIGDACDAQTCGNGTREGDAATMAGVEECDDGDRIADAICDANCQLVANDCADGFDNDGDGKIDYGVGPTNDPGCQNELAFASESPQCDDGRDNDGDGLVDFPAETKCQNRFDNDELTDPATGCGLLGIELLAPVMLLHARRRAQRRSRITRRS